MNLINEVKNTILRQRLLSIGDKIILAVSGGPDSVALAYILHVLEAELGLRVHIAHFNHRLRKDANQDQKFVESLAARLHWPCTIGAWTNRNRRETSLEERAREQRFNFLKRVAAKENTKIIVLAHTQDDLAETVFMHILRGTGLQGLRGILPKRTLENISFVRPLLGFPKSAILSFLKKKRLAYRVDSTNRQTKFFRNKIRLKLLPLLEKDYNQNIRKILANLADNITTDYNYLEEGGKSAYKKLAKMDSRRMKIKFPLKAFHRLHPAIKRIVVRQGIEHLQGNTHRLTLKHMKEIEDLLLNRPQGSIIHLPSSLSVKKDSHFLTLTARKTCIN